MVCLLRLWELLSAIEMWLRPLRGTGNSERQKYGAQVFADVVEDVIYKRYDFRNDPAPYLNRHGILHGRVPDYADKLNSIRVFLLVDAIAYLWLEKQQQTPLSASQ